MKRAVISLVLAAGLLCSGAASAEEVPGLFHRSAVPEALQVIERRDLANSDWHLAAILQGMANREQPRLYIVQDASGPGGDVVWLDYYAREYGIENQGRISLEDALIKFAGLFTGYALFSHDESWTVNAADTWCSIHDCLPVTAEQEALARGAGLGKVEDFRGRWKNNLDCFSWSIKELLPACSKKTAASLTPAVNNPRDYCYAHRIFMFYLAPSGREYFALLSLLKALPKNIPMTGYIARNGIEEWIVEYSLAGEGKFMVPTDGVPNLTVHSGIPMAPLPPLDPPAAPPDLRGKLGVVLAFTDGDNLHLEAEYYLKPDYWPHPERGKIKAAWSLAPELYELAPGMLRYYYRTRTENDFFVALSGAGYTFPSAYSDPEFFKDVSVQYMKLTGLDILWSLDPPHYFAVGGRAAARLLHPLGDDGCTRGVLAGYAPPITMRDFRTPPGCPPVLYCKPNYYDQDRESLLAMIKADAALVPPRGRVVFYGLNSWIISCQDLLEIQSALAGRDDVVFLSPGDAVSIIQGRRK